jgi:transposase
MIRIDFNQAEIQLLKKEKDKNPNPKIRRRVEVVYLKSKGLQHKQIQDITGFSPTQVTKLLNLYQMGGLEAIKTLHYQGQPSKLHHFKDELKSSFEKKPFATLKEAKARIAEISGISLSLTQVKEFLDKMGIKRRKVKQIPDKVHIQKQEAFKKTSLSL